MSKASSGMSSRERLLRAIERRGPDRIPLWFLWRGPGTIRWRSEFERIRETLSWGIDDSFLLKLPPPEPAVPSRVWIERQPGEPYPIIHKVYETPRGPLGHAARMTEDWPHGDDIPVRSDHVVARAVKHLIETAGDLERFRSILRPMTSTEIDALRERAREARAFCDRHGVLLEGGRIALGDAAFWLCGPESLIYSVADDPGLVEELVTFLHEWEVPRMEILLECGVDTVIHRGWYECPDFWPPEIYRSLLKPLIKKEVDLVHSGGARFTYIMTKGILPLLDDFLDLGIDSLWGVDPVMGEADLGPVRDGIGGRICIWGGVNAAVTLGRGSREEIRDAVRTAVEILGPGGGFVLFPVDQIFVDTPWESVHAMIEAWREVCT